MLKVGNLVINLGAIVYVDLDSSSGVKIYLKANDDAGNLTGLFFKGEEAEYLRKYFLSVAALCGSVE